MFATITVLAFPPSESAFTRYRRQSYDRTAKHKFAYYNYYQLSLSHSTTDLLYIVTYVTRQN